jgi:hypothetical protein
LLEERLVAAHELSSALEYLQEQGWVVKVQQMACRLEIPNLLVYLFF